MKKILLCIFMLFVLALSVSATKTFTGEDILVNQDINDNIVLAGNSVTVLSNIEGDVFSASGESLISGEINGDVVSAAGEVKVTNTVNGDVRVAGGSVIISAKVTGDVLVMAGEVKIADDAYIGGDLLINGGNVDLSGLVEKDATINAGTLTFSGKVLKNMEVNAGEFIIKGSPHIEGNLRYSSPEKKELSGLTVGGTTEFSMIEQENQTKSFGWLRLLMCLILGLVIVGIFSRFTSKTTLAMKRSFLKTLLIGILFIIVVPILIIILLITIIGIPLAFLVLMAYVAVLLLSNVFFSVLIGKAVFRIFTDKPKCAISSFILGAVVLFLIFKIPIIGAIMKIIAILAGTGAIVMACRMKSAGKSDDKKTKKVKVEHYHEINSYNVAEDNHKDYSSKKAPKKTTKKKSIKKKKAKKRSVKKTNKARR